MIPEGYPAKESYTEPSVAEEYEGERFSGVMGRYRRHRELRAVGAVLEQLPDGVSILDCPCGNGRWWSLLAPKTRELRGMDISTAMLQYARRRAETEGLEVDLFRGDAESIPLDDNSVDYTFSFALTKHLPRLIQYRVLAEFARVSRRGVVVTFGVFTPLTYEIWRRRGLRFSYPVIREELDWIAAAANLEVEDLRKCTTPIGVEHVVLMRKLSSPPVIDLDSVED